MKNILLLLAFTAVITACDCEVEKKEGKNDYFSLFDANNDGNITKNEFSDYIVIAYAKKDANKDGIITRNECTHFDILNTDGDDVISDEEFENNNGDIFIIMDYDADGLVTEEELKNHLIEMKKERENIK